MFRIFGFAIFVLMVAGLTPPMPVYADAPAQDAAAARLAQEPALYCFAKEAAMSPQELALAKIAFDHDYGVMNAIEGDEWAATYTERFQFFADYLGIPNPVREDGTLLPWCGRLVGARQKILAVVGNQ